MRILKKKLNCCICNTCNEVDDIYSASGSGAGDLDSRPPFMIRYLVSHQIDVCKKCGYCNTQLDKKLINAEVLIKSSDYKKQLKDLSFSDKASAYCCRAMILESDNQTVDAAWSFLKAAWICDDRKKNRKAVICRKSALEMFGKSREHNRKIFKTAGKEFLADRPELERELKNAVREVLRQLRLHLSRKTSQEAVKRRQNIYSKYLPLIAEFSHALSGKTKPPNYHPMLKNQLNIEEKEN